MSVDAPDWRTRPTITIPEYARIMGVSITTAYDAARRREFPTIRIRRRVLGHLAQ
jgi:predicted DNA-binding transcriptional regulator AlpA